MTAAKYTASVRAPWIAVFLATSACGYAWQPPTTPPASPGVHLEGATLLRLPEGDEIALAWTTTPSRAVAEFTFIDGRGYDLTVDQLCERYTRVVGQDDVTALLKRNRNVSTAWWAGAVAAFGATGGVIAGVEHGNSVGGAALVSVAVGVPLGALLVIWHGVTDAPALANLTLEQAETLVHRYNKAVHHAATPAPKESGGLPEVNPQEIPTR
jgi:hypothetical protein